MFSLLQLVANTSIVVIHPGSCNLRLGLASDAFPHVLPHCIAYRHKNPGQQKHYEDLVLTRPQSQVCPFIDVRHKNPGQQKHYEDLVLTRPQSQVCSFIDVRHKNPGQQKHYEDLVLTRPQSQVCSFIDVRH